MIMTTDIFSVLQFDTAWLPLLHFKFVFFIKIMNKRTFFQQGIVPLSVDSNLTNT